MELKVIYMIAACVVLISSGVYAFAEKQDFRRQIKLFGLLAGTGEMSVRLSGDMKDFVCTTFDNSKVLNLEFLDEADNLTIEVWCNKGNCLFSETTHVIHGLHIIIDLSKSEALAFKIHIFDNSVGTYMSGNFELT